MDNIKDNRRNVASGYYPMSGFDNQDNELGWYEVFQLVKLLYHQKDPLLQDPNIKPENSQLWPTINQVS
jgi:hypothetical protein